MNQIAQDVVSQESGFSLAELMIVAASEAWRGDGEVLASGIGVVPRLGASLAKMTHSPLLLMTDSETFLVETPIPLGPRGDFKPAYSGYMSFDRVFECVWGGKRHAMIGPTQIDRYGQTNLSVVGDYARPKAAMLGVRGLPGNSINHANSFFVPNHSPRVFVKGEVDMVSGVGYQPARWPKGANAAFVDLRRIVTNLCVMDFEGKNRACRVRSLHPGVSFDEVQAATGFELEIGDDCPVTAAPTQAQLELIRWLDPHNLRATVIKNNPPGVRGA
ncbi:ketoacid CoA transferase [Pandoraea captiosa]|uniref:Ketoacid CoA transferase n=1 Tax=Pandoraea captiosa TaxID=2508302 RepID=A0A5E5AA86_9BURK|nr:ketoacid CoA transferase [Pandoraea captiosa]VVE70078.1 ketoacid CoA transferase [Pandoraea captiosa]